MSFKIERVETLPSAVRTSSKVYDDIVTATLAKPPGAYAITLEGKKPGTLYIQLVTRAKKNKNLQVHKIEGIVYLSKLR